MKTNATTAPYPHLAALKCAKENKLLPHVLSPLERAAMNHLYQPFTYRVAGLDAYVSTTLCKQLLDSTAAKLRLLYALVEKEKQSQHIPRHLRETFDDPRLVLALPPRLRNRLCRLQCYTLYAIMQAGPGFFKKQNFSPQAIHTLRQLFANRGCGDLF